ncbi:DNA repair and recombination protein RAD26 [Dendryphion nanum]|uniref:DNA repair and recombination protein RAD26 n=1 Tax=Dendryphion nanum TaxID=256645 RepID=A0A9P9I6Q8_9PLEO|nr:DNA repair and recombination protein RAD26 [Dendryphion nanum]
MIRKPFRPPSFVRSSLQSQSRSDAPPPAKKRRTSSESVSERKPLQSVSNASATSLTDPNERYYKVLWRKYTTKKNKTWDGDGVLSIIHGNAVLADSETGKEIGKCTCGRPLLPGSTLAIGGKEVEIEDVIAKADYITGRIFLRGKANVAVGQEKEVMIIDKRGRAIKAGDGHKKLIDVHTAQPNVVPTPAVKPKAARTQFRTPLLNSTVVPKTNSSVPQPRHDPTLPNALVMKRPKIVPKGKQVVDVVVDPILSKHLRDHQREGVKFLYECVMGMRCEGEGAIMADEMGLGKTLQTITLLWTLLKQNPIYESGPVVTKALVVCPAGLVENWRREFRKWLGKERIGVYVVDSNHRQITNFTMGKAYNVMIVGYEMLRIVQEELKKGSGVDIVIADEGHRLKSAKNKAMLAIQSLNTERRIILSGTPLQNDLSEFYTAIDFVNPGLLGKRTAFKREFETPIVRSRQPNASEAEFEKGDARWKELVSLTGQFMIRRTADVLSKYLPPKTEHIVFCKPTTAQAAAYRSILASPIFTVALGSTEMALQLITILKKMCNSPSLLKSSQDPDEAPSEMIQSLLPLIPSHILSSHACSTKLRILDSLLHRLFTTTKEKIVIVSNYTTTLDMIQNLLTSLSYPFLRLDGSTPSSKRQPLVEKFNHSDSQTHFAFLLSAKSGGVGINLIGASRIVLFDIDWNPATDLQAMARIHRDGQKLPCKIYRFVVQGAIEERILQRQVVKMGLADAIVDGRGGESRVKFSKEELRDLFRLDEREEGCATHELVGCGCRGWGVEAEGAAEVDAKVNDEDDGKENENENAILTLRPASRVNMAVQEAALERRRERKRNGGIGKEGKKLGMLLNYAHIDPRFLRKRMKEDGDTAELASMVDDDVFLEVLKEADCRVGFVMTKSST